MKSKVPAQIYVNMHDFYNLSMYKYFLICFHIQFLGEAKWIRYLKVKQIKFDS